MGDFLKEKILSRTLFENPKVVNEECNQKALGSNLLFIFSFASIYLIDFYPALFSKRIVANNTITNNVEILKCAINGIPADHETIQTEYQNLNRIKQQEKENVDYLQQETIN